MHRMLSILFVGLLVAIAHPAATVLAMGSDSGTWPAPKPKDDDKDKDKNKHGDLGKEYELASADIAAGNFARALPRLRDIVAAEPSHADAWNLIGYASRKIGEMEMSFKAYQTALSISPEHRGAREYLGEWYLQSGDVAGALDQYRHLAALCSEPCEEKTELEEAIVDYSVARLDDAAIRTVQAKLAEAGFYAGKPDGQFDEASAAALRAFQLARGIDEIGLLEKTRQALHI